MLLIRPKGHFLFIRMTPPPPTIWQDLHVTNHRTSLFEGNQWLIGFLYKADMPFFLVTSPSMPDLPQPIGSFELPIG